MTQASIAVFASELEQIVWGPIMLTLLLGTGIYLTIGLKFMPIRRLKAGFKSLLSHSSTTHDPSVKGITPLQALMTSLSGTIGSGNIIGVATAIIMGGPGAVFWMWVTALCGMASKYSEGLLAIKYRTKNKQGFLVGGPMYYMKLGLPKKWVWLGSAYAILMVLGGLATGNMIQANSISQVLKINFSIDPTYSAIGLCILIFSVIIGGIQSISRLAEFTVPIMTGLYLLIGTIILVLNYASIPSAFTLIFDGAFSGTAAVGGFAGAAIKAAIQAGVARGLYSNEAGAGSAAIAHGSSENTDPIKQGEIAMLGTFIDTIIVCTMTSLIILTVQIETSGINQDVWSLAGSGANLTSRAFSAGFSGGGYVVIVGQLIFAFTTMITWSFYVESAAVYLGGERVAKLFRIIYIMFVFIGCVSEFKTIWSFGVALFGIMALPNLITLLLKSKEIFAMTKEAHDKRQQALNE